MVTYRAGGRRVVPLDHPATWRDLETHVPEDMIGEIVDGELVVMPRPATPHTHSTSVLGMLLGGPFQFGVNGPGGWIIHDEPYIRFGRDVRAPDLAGWRRERWVSPGPRGPVRVIPDWICEVLSPSTENEDRTAKMRLYRRHGVHHLWLIHPLSQTLEVYRQAESGWLVAGTFGGTERVRAEPFDAVELDLSFLWEPAAGEASEADDDEDE